MAPIEPLLRFCVLPAAVAPFGHCKSAADAIYVFMSFSELERIGWVAILWLTADAIVTLVRRAKK